VLFLALSAPAFSQQAADFSGVWDMDPARSESAHQAVPIGPVTLVIKATASDLTIETRRAAKGKVRASREKLTFLLDGSENTIPDKAGAPIKTKARFDGPKLIAETARTIQGSTVTTVQAFHLEGKDLIVDKTLTIQHGYQSPTPDANNAGKGTDTFVRSPSHR
jgi:hypothetical protein